MEEKFPKLRQPPRDQTIGICAATAPSAPGDTPVEEVFPGADSGGRWSSASFGPPRALPNSPTISNIEISSSLLTSPFLHSRASSATDGDDTGGGCGERGHVRVPPSSTSSRTKAPVPSFRDTRGCPPQSVCGAKGRRRIDPKNPSFGRSGNGDGERHLQRKDDVDDDGAVSPSCQDVSTSAHSTKVLNCDANGPRIRTVLPKTKAGRLRRRVPVALTHSEETDEDLAQSGEPPRRVVLPYQGNAEVLPQGGAHHLGDEAVNAAQLAVRSFKDSSVDSDNSIPQGRLGSDTVGAPVESAGEALVPTNLEGQHAGGKGAVGKRNEALLPKENALHPVRETFSIPRYCPDDLLAGQENAWVPGKPLRVAYITWNMGSRRPRTSEVSAFCIHPNAHLVVVGTQENGPYVVSNKVQRKWTKTVAHACLGGQYDLVGKHHMWAVQMLVFARRRDVAKYVSRIHDSHVKTGLLNGLGGNKGGVAVGLALSLKVKKGETPICRTPVPITAYSAPCVSLDRAMSAPELTSVNVAAEVSRDLFTSKPSHSQGDSERTNPSKLVASYTAPSSFTDRHKQAPLSKDVDEKRSISSGSSASIPGDDGNNTTPEDDDIFSSKEMYASIPSPETSPQGTRCFPNHEDVQGFESQESCEESPRINDDASRPGAPNAKTPNYMTLLFITAHLAAHQGAVKNRNEDYRKIVGGLRVGRRGPHRKFFKALLRGRQVLACDDKENPSEDDDRTHECEEDSSGEDVQPLRLPSVSAEQNTHTKRRDVTEEFDVTFFGGDLNYRINGTRKAIEYVIEHHRNIRSILINNDQLSLERARGRAFQGFQEGNLRFRPTYKYEVSAGGGVTLDEYNFSHKKSRMPAYCDRILYKKKMCSSAGRIVIRLYTDVPNVRSSDHRPVVALFDIDTPVCSD